MSKGADLPLKVEEPSSVPEEPHSEPAQAVSLSDDRPVAPAKPKKTKAQLWNEIKVKCKCAGYPAGSQLTKFNCVNTAITRSITAIYLLPMLHLQTTSQLTLLSRLHLLRTFSAEHHGIPPESDEDEDDDVSIFSVSAQQPITASKLVKAKNAIIKPWSYFSLQEMGLQDIAEEQGQVSSDGLTSLAGGIWRSIVSSVAGQAPPTPVATSSGGPLHVRLDSETERLFLCMSWWFLHVGWRILEEEAEQAVGEVCKK